MTDLIPLQQLPDGHTGRVGQLMGRAEQVRRLQELGFCDGVEVEMVQMGSPCVIRLGGKKLGFRAADVLRVMVRPEELR